jgi:hypothetical protein
VWREENKQFMESRESEFENRRVGFLVRHPYRIPVAERTLLGNDLG